MSIHRPYFRIYRPGIHIPNYCTDVRNADNCATLCRSLALLEQDLSEVFSFIEPCDVNLKTYSHRLYEIFLRASTEFETNAKEILQANGYAVKAANRLNICDFHRLESATRLSEFKIDLSLWWPKKRVMAPFLEWNEGPSLRWYLNYNAVKHNRHHEFRQANLENTLEAVSAVVAILYCQFDFNTFTAHKGNQAMFSLGNDACFPMSDTMFQVITPTGWSDEEKYQFDWEHLRDEAQPFQKYNFCSLPRLSDDE
jgi:hypothetical protein